MASQPIPGGGFKTFRRGRRAQLPEENFNLGMNFTNAPLPMGANKVLVNYDIREQGNLLAPRPGLRAFEVALNPQKIPSGFTPIAYNPAMMLADGRSCVELDNRQYKQLVVGQPSDTLLTGTAVHKGLAYLATVFPQGESYEAVDAIPPVLDAAIASREMHLEPISSDLAVNYTTFTRPAQAGIHGIPLVDLNYIAKHIGTFAFNNGYYCFRHTAAGAGSLIRSVLDKSAQRNYYKPEVLSPKAITPKEAVMWGYNMLQDNPYTFANTAGAGTIILNGLLPYDKDGALMMSPQVNQDIYLECFYSAPVTNTYTFLWEWKEPSGSAWTQIKSESLSMAALPDAKATFNAPITQVMIRVTVTKQGDTIPEQVMTVGFNLDKGAYGSTANIAPVTYSIPKARGLVYWKSRLVAYGLEDPTVMLMSEINTPNYFPYPNNGEIFDEPVVYVLPFLDYLLVFTTTKLYLITLSPDGLSWTKRVLQGGLDIKDWDMHLTQVVKNMVFFKSGNYYYMVVPKAYSATGDLAIAPIAKPIEAFLDTFKENIDSAVDAVYDYNEGLELVHYYNFLDFEDVHNVYVFKTISGLYINVVLLYNIVARNWRLYMQEGQHIQVPFKQDATKKGILMSLLPLNQRYLKADGATTQVATLPAVQFMQFNPLEVSDTYIPLNLKVYPAVLALPAELDNVNTALAAVHTFKNYQLLDTGYREHNSNNKKRYREIQVKFNNISQRSLRFFTEFLIDGELRRAMYKYNTVQNIVPESPDYGVITLERELVDPSILPGATVLAGSEQDTDCWQLDVSAFPEQFFWKVRLPVSGKGYAPRLRLISYNEQRYELLNLLWIYRNMNSR